MHRTVLTKAAFAAFVFAIDAEQLTGPNARHEDGSLSSVSCIRSRTTFMAPPLSLRTLWRTGPCQCEPASLTAYGRSCGHSQLDSLSRRSRMGVHASHALLPMILRTRPRPIGDKLPYPSITQRFHSLSYYPNESTNFECVKPRLETRLAAVVFSKGHVYFPATDALPNISRNRHAKVVCRLPQDEVRHPHNTPIS